LAASYSAVFEGLTFGELEIEISYLNILKQCFMFHVTSFQLFQIYFKFAEILNTLPPPVLIDPASTFGFELMSPIMSCIIRLEPRYLCMFFEFPGTMAYDRDYLRRIFLKVSFRMSGN